MSARKDAKRITRCLRKEPQTELAPVHGNVVSVVCDWLDDGNTARAIRGLEAAVKYEGVQIHGGTKQRPKAIRLNGSTSTEYPSGECQAVVALNKLGKRVESETVEVKSFNHLADLLEIPGADENALKAAVEGMEAQGVLLLCQHVWPWEMLFLKTPVS